MTKIEVGGTVKRVLQFFKLPRSGDIPIGFYGELLSSRNGRALWGREPARWYELSVYRTVADKFVVAVAYRTAEGDEDNYDKVLLCEDVEDLVQQLKDYDREHAVIITFRPLIARLADDLGLVEVIDLPNST